MTKQIVLQFYAGGGANGLGQIMMAEAGEYLSGVSLREISDATAAGSVGNFTALTSLQKRENPNISVFTLLRTQFRETAKLTICGAQREEQLVNGVIHDIHHSLHSPRNPFVDRSTSNFWNRFTKSFKSRASCAVLKDKTGLIHLDPTPLADMITSSFGEITLNDIDQPYFSYALDQSEGDFVCFSNLGKSDALPIQKNNWSDAILLNKGGDYTLRDVVSASIAAPTLFQSHKTNGNHFIDCASFQSPLGLVRNLLRMMSEDVHIHVLYMGTGRQENDVTSPETYNNLGSIHSQHAYINDIAMATLRREMRELRDVYSDKVTVHQIDAVLPSEYNGHAFARDPFNGSNLYMDAIEDITGDYIANNESLIRRPFEMVAEAKARSSSVDPTVVRLPCISNENHAPAQLPQAKSTRWSIGRVLGMGRTPV